MTRRRNFLDGCFSCNRGGKLGDVVFGDDEAEPITPTAPHVGPLQGLPAPAPGHTVIDLPGDVYSPSESSAGALIAAGLTAGLLAAATYRHKQRR